MISDLRKLLIRWKTSGFISHSTYRSLLCSDGCLPRAYGLPKIHKPGYQFRLIVSSIDSPFYSLAYFLHKIIVSKEFYTTSHIENSIQLIEKLKNVKLDDRHVLLSLDVISLFTNIPLDLAVDSVSKRLDNILEDCKIPKNEFIIALKMILESTYFSFNNLMYRQNFGTPMGSPLSSIIADLVLIDIEDTAINSLNISLPFYIRYVDDILLAAPSDSIKDILNTFNSFHPRLQFILEIGGDKLNFLMLPSWNLKEDWSSIGFTNQRFLADIWILSMH